MPVDPTMEPAEAQSLAQATNPPEPTRVRRRRRRVRLSPSHHTGKILISTVEKIKNPGKSGGQPEISVETLIDAVGGLEWEALRLGEIKRLRAAMGAALTRLSAVMPEAAAPVRAPVRPRVVPRWSEPESAGEEEPDDVEPVIEEDENGLPFVAATPRQLLETVADGTEIQIALPGGYVSKNGPVDRNAGLPPTHPLRGR